MDVPIKRATTASDAKHDSKGMQWHYRARADRTVDLDNLFLREELERPQAKHVEAKLKNHRGGDRYPRVATETTDTPTDTLTTQPASAHTTAESP